MTRLVTITVTEKSLIYALATLQASRESVRPDSPLIDELGAAKAEIRLAMRVGLRT